MMNPVVSYQVGKYRVNDLLKDAERRRLLNLVEDEHPRMIQVFFKILGDYLNTISDQIKKWARIQRSDALSS